MKVITNGKFILPQQVVEKHHLIFTEVIAALEPDSTPVPEGAQLIDAQGCYVSAGFINIHIHGTNGSDTMDGTADALATMSAALTKTGVTSFLPTTMTASWESINRALANIKNCQHKYPGAKILGANVEGPFINQQYKGAQKEEYIEQAAFTKIAPYQDLIKLLTLAPETLKEKSFISQCVKAGIIISLGHSAATYEEALGAIGAGASHITHLFNAMSGLHHRKPGLVGAALDSPATVELICDNIHVHPMLQRLVYQIKGPHKIILITDAMRAAGLGDGESELGGQKVFVHSGKATLADGTIAGSVLTMNMAVHNFLTNTGASLPEVINMVTLNPAKELGLSSSLGSLEAGKYADLTIFDEAFQIKQTFVNGVLCK